MLYRGWARGKDVKLRDENDEGKEFDANGFILQCHIGYRLLSVDLLRNLLHQALPPAPLTSPLLVLMAAITAMSLTVWHHLSNFNRGLSGSSHFKRQIDGF